jgi:hypothetical protein
MGEKARSPLRRTTSPSWPTQSLSALFWDQDGKLQIKLLVRQSSASAEQPPLQRPLGHRGKTMDRNILVTEPQWNACRVVFSVSRDGYRTTNVELSGCSACFDRSIGLDEQASAAVAEWMSRQERVHGYRYQDAKITYIEVTTDDGRYLNATKRGWDVLVDAHRREAIERAGYRICNNGLSHGWYALPPGETEYKSDECGHNYLGFFSSEMDLLLEVFELISVSTTAD